MLHSMSGLSGCVTAPHLAAALAGRDILEAGGSAIEAMVAAAATIAVVYPHMNSIGGDGFWLIHEPGGAPVGISACGRAAERATPDWYAARGITSEMPVRGPLAALTVPGTIAGWMAALDRLPAARRLPLADLLAAARRHASEGIVVTGNQADCTAAKAEGLRDIEGFAPIFMPGGEPPMRRSVMRQAALAETIAILADEGLDSYYRGALAEIHASFLEEAGSPLRLSDFTRFSAETVSPLSVDLSVGRVFNMPPPTQGVAALTIIALFDRLGVDRAEGFAHIHGLVEATKRAFTRRNAELGDPDFMAEPAEDWLSAEALDGMAAGIDWETALVWPTPPAHGDTIWMGAADREGRLVSFIQSVYWEFGSGLTCPRTGVVFQNRGAGFSLRPGPNQLGPFRRPFHTLNPAMAFLADGRRMAYGTMGGDGQPQTQAQIFSRYALFGGGLQEAVTAPRFLLGRTWGDAATTLKLESRFDPALVEKLAKAGHIVERLPDFSDLAGHAGAVVVHPGGVMEGASDPRADGAAIAF